MPTATLRFTLPEEDNEHRKAINGSRFASVLWNVDQECRGWIKYGHKFDDVNAALDAVRTAIREELDSNGLTLDDVM